MDRDQMLAVVQDGYAARVRGDIDGVMRAFSPDASFSLNAAPEHGELSVRIQGADQLRAVQQQLSDAYEFLDHTILDFLVDGSKAAIRSLSTVRARATGNIAKTELLDLIEFRDGKISSLTQFFDTALAMRLAAPV